MEVTFRVGIKEFSTKALVSLDLSSRITLECDNLPIDIKNKLNEIQSSDKNKSQEVNIILSI